MKNAFLFLLLAITVQTHAQINRQWVATYNGQGDYNDRYTCIVRDAAGNYYLGGSTVNSGTDRDFLIQKTDAAGAVLWTLVLNGSGNAADEVASIQLAPSGRLIATGISKGDNTSEDFLTLSLTTDGDTIWTRSYDFTGEYDQPNALAVDAAGNIIVTGLSDGDPGSGENDDYLTLKYNADGVLLWANRFNGLGNAIDRAVGVATNASGQVFVTGRSDNGINDDYVTICYNANGTQQWIKYDDRGDRDRATALTLDPSGNLLITGQSDNGDNDDFWTLKYTTAGVLLWQKAYDFVDDDRALAITTDQNGNVFITGQSDQDFTAGRNWDIATVAFSATGSPLWAARYDGSVSQDAFPTAIATDATGHVFVTGLGDNDPGITIDHEIITVSYLASNGTQSWLSTYAGLANRDNASNAVTSDGNGGCWVAGYAEDNTAFRNALRLRYSGTGAKISDNEFSGVGDNNDAVRRLAADDLGNVYAAGFTVSNGDNRNLMMARFTSGGLFDCRYVENGSAASAIDDAQGLIIAGDGNPIVMGYVKNSGSSNDIFLSKFNATCDTLWARNINGSANGSERAYHMSRDGNGSVLLTGRSDQLPGPLANDVCYTMKVNESTGAVAWIKKFDADTTGAERGIVVKAKDPNQIYVAGRAFNGTDYDIFLLKYDALGNLLWSKPLTTTGSNEEPIDMAISAAGNIYILGNSSLAGADTIHDIMLLKFNAAGALQNAVFYNHSTNGNDEGVALAIAGNDNIIIAGKSDLAPGAAVRYGISLLKYDQNTNLLWAKTLPSNSLNDQIPDAMTLNSSGQIYLAAHRNDGSDVLPDNNVVAMVCNPNGDLIWSDTYSGDVVNGSDIPNTILLKNNDFYLGGSTFKAGQQRDMLVIKYSGTVTATHTPADTALAVYPNPAGDVLHIKGLAGYEEASIELLDVAGRMLERQRISENAACDLTRLDSGLYFFHIVSNGQSILTGKFTHLK